MLFENRDKIVFAGDSITDAGKKAIMGQRNQGLGTGYVSAFDAILAVSYPEKSFLVYNMGISGNKICDLKARWQEVMDLNPDQLFIFIGINDVWHIYGAPEREHRDIIEFERDYEELILNSKDKVKNLILISPYYMEPNKEDLVRKEMDRYGKVVRKLSDKYSLKFIDIQSAFDKYLTHKHSSYIAWDRVHPTAVGANLIAREIFRAIDFDGDFI